ncbi:MAG: CPBP family intramembrane metalloprotease [Candidatus Thalassarchaeum sp.]|nr:CPBP family intramembrane metalloprotease [Candidatus Thalassarchaeum sp.]
MDDKRRALIALLLVGLAPTTSILISFGTEGGLFSQIAYILSKIWMVALPLYWYLKIDGGTLSWSKPERGGYGMAIGLGLGMSAIMLAAWLLLGKGLDDNLLRNAVEPVGLLDARLYIGAVLYWILVNSLLEEYVFRWFLVVKSETVVGTGTPAIILSALFFVLHHTVALAFFGFPWWANLLASSGLFVGGAVFSWLYIRYRSIWIPYIAHAICDVTVFSIGAIMLF